MITRLAAAIAERARNRFPGGASSDLLSMADAALDLRRPFRADDTITLGRTGNSVQVSRLAMGTGSNGWGGSSNQTRKLGIKGLSDLFLYGFHEHGINFWDSADQYGSHPHMAEGLRQVDREKIVVLTKSTANSAREMCNDLDRFRRELGTEYIDILLLHCKTAANWNRDLRPLMDVISDAQERGIVRVKGVSCHSFPALKAAAHEPWVEVDLARINPGGQNMDASPDAVVPVLQEMKQAGKSVIGMKLFANRRLVDRKTECMRFVLGLDCVDCFTIGFQSRQELDQVVALIEEA